MTYKIGQILTSDQDVEVRKALSDEKVILPKGTKVIIGADKLAHHIRTDMIQPLGDAEVKGYDSEGLAEYLAMVLMARLPISEMLNDYDLDEKAFKEEIVYALDDIGF